ncbi:MAG: MmgE/PrpD family protein [Reinekea sp.]
MEFTPAGETRTLVHFSQKLYQTGLNITLSQKLKTLIVDQIGLQIGCAEFPWSKSTYNYFSSRFPSPGNATIAYYGDTVSPEQAAFTNGCFGHAQDFDDTCLKVQTHPACVIIPVAFAMGEEVGATGEQVLRAAAAGMEVMLRIAHSVSPGCLQRGHHTPQATGPFGASIAAGLLLGLDEEALLNAMGIAGSFSGGLIEYTQSGGSVKRIHGSIPTTAGIRAAYLAADKLTGPATVLEGKKGFCNVYSDTTDISRLTDRLYEKYMIHEVALKFYNCCYFIHAPLEATLSLIKEHVLKPYDIEHIRVGTCKHGTTHVGRIKKPEDALGAQFSTHFTIALAILREIPGLTSFTDPNLWDHEIREYASRISVCEDPVCTAEYPENWGTNVEITTLKGTIYSKRVRFPKGNPENPMSEEEISNKFYRNVDGKMTHEQSQKLYATIMQIEQLDNIRELTKHMVSPACHSEKAETELVW